MEVFAHVTQRLDRRICVRFDERPPDEVLTWIRRHGKFRPVGDGSGNAWHFKQISWHVLLQTLRQKQQWQLAERVRAVVKQWRDSDAAEASERNSNKAAA